MRRYLCGPLALCGMILSSCHAPSPEVAAPPKPVAAPTAETVPKAKSTPRKAKLQSPADFMAEFKAALRSGDPAAVARLARFPLENALVGVEGFEDVESRKGFLKHFDDIFQENARQKLLDSSLNGETRDEGGWTIFYGHSAGGEGDWSVSYHFARVQGGAIRLVSIDFSG